jgi:hypothetical protein
VVTSPLVGDTWINGDTTLQRVDVAADHAVVVRILRAYHAALIGRFGARTQHAVARGAVVIERERLGPAGRVQCQRGKSRIDGGDDPRAAIIRFHQVVHARTGARRSAIDGGNAAIVAPDAIAENAALDIKDDVRAVADPSTAAPSAFVLPLTVTFERLTVPFRVKIAPPRP